MKRILLTILTAALFNSSALAQDGAPDPSFGTGTFGTGRVVVPINTGGNNADVPRAVAVDVQGRVVVAGTATTAGDDVIAVVRVLANGQLDSSFSGDGRTTISVAGSDLEGHAIALQADGKVLVAGEISTGLDRDFLVVRLLDDGSLDTTFDADGISTVAFNIPGAIRDSARAIALGAGNRIVLAGYAADAVSTSVMAVARLTTTGALDTSFDGDGRKTFSFSVTPARDTLAAVSEDRDGSLLLAGSTNSSGNTNFAVVKLLANGNLDAAFGNAAAGRSLVSFDLGGSNFDSASGFAQSAGGFIFVAGSAETSGSGSHIAIAKLDLSGALDPSFFGGGRQTISFAADGANYATGNSIFLQSNGAIVVGGQAARPVVSFDFATARLQANGVLDSGFGTGGRQLLGFDLGASNNDNGLSMTFANNQLVSAGSVQRSFNAGADRDFGIVRQTIDLIFANGFD